MPELLARMEAAVYDCRLSLRESALRKRTFAEQKATMFDNVRQGCGIIATVYHGLSYVVRIICSNWRKAEAPFQDPTSSF